MSAYGGSRRPCNIVVLSDGTGNSSGALFRTNVWRLYKTLDLEDRQNPPEPRQFALYDDGVGTSWFKPLALIGGAFGYGLARNVRELYAFVCRTYQPGDQIYVFGFSRGAFTVRFLLGLIYRQGLVPYDGDEAQFQADVTAAYRAYRAERFHTIFRHERIFRAIRDAAIAAKNLVTGTKPYRRLDQSRLGRWGTDPIPIRFLGVWDTVAAYGLPIEELTRAVDRFVWPMSFRHRELGKSVKAACHALALDDERQSFHPLLWTEAKPEDAARLRQVWFAGAHSDVGGGYPDDAAAYVPLNWMIEAAAAAGLRFLPEVRADYLTLTDENGLLHDSRTGLAGYYRYKPRRIERLLRADAGKVEISRIKVHESALRRIRVGEDAYAPIVLPDNFIVERIDGRIETGDAYLGHGEWGRLAEAREDVFNIVWLRRLAYYLTLCCTLFLGLMPLWWPGTPDGACRSALCWISPIFAPVRAFTPAFAGTWLDSFAANPGIFLVGFAGVVIGLSWGAALQRSIGTAMRAVWYSILKTRPPHLGNPVKPRTPGLAQRLIRRLRLLPGYEATVRVLAREVMPAIAFAAALFVALGVGAKAWFSVDSARGRVCLGSPDPKPLGPGAVTAPAPFLTSEPCMATGVKLLEGGAYRLTFSVPADRGWFDASLPAGPYGNDPEAEGAALITPFVPYRRHWGQNWFKPMARIGSHGTDVYPLTPRPSAALAYPPGPPPADQPPISCPAAPSAELSFATEIVARTTGELFLYVNDAIWPGIPFLSDRYGAYRNNRGGACVTVERLVAPVITPDGVGVSQNLSERS